MSGPMRGYFGIGIVEGKSTENVGGLWRSAHALGASMIFTIGFRPPRQPTDTTCAAGVAHPKTSAAHRPRKDNRSTPRAF